MQFHRDKSRLSAKDAVKDRVTNQVAESSANRCYTPVVMLVPPHHSLAARNYIV